jgi:hypothetical protein
MIARWHCLQIPQTAPLRLTLTSCDGSWLLLFSLLNQYFYPLSIVSSGTDLRIGTYPFYHHHRSQIFFESAGFIPVWLTFLLLKDAFSLVPIL